MQLINKNGGLLFSSFFVYIPFIPFFSSNFLILVRSPLGFRSADILNITNFLNTRISYPTVNYQIVCLSWGKREVPLDNTKKSSAKCL